MVRGVYIGMSSTIPVPSGGNSSLVISLPSGTAARISPAERTGARDIIKDLNSTACRQLLQ